MGHWMLYGLWAACEHLRGHVSWLEDSFSGRVPNLVIFEVDFVAQLPSTEDLPAHPALMRLAPAFGKHQPTGFLLVRATLMENRQPGLDLSPPWNAAYLQKELLQNLKCQPHNSRDSDFISSLESGQLMMNSSLRYPETCLVSSSLVDSGYLYGPKDLGGAHVELCWCGWHTMGLGDGSHGEPVRLPGDGDLCFCVLAQSPIEQAVGCPPPTSHSVSWPCSAAWGSGRVWR
ncbi:uncharacterized protein LOC124229856 [Equus quagga]|uniref:uncharacterized protein LOC124229856 n=1 Tax=Equus quagga TaxID=89248 RepID=UPI001EE24CA2|nr:uncharacterized protein LOC124229856 [Equus quagga]